MSSNRGSRVVISGIGVVSPFGIGREKFWESVSQGKSGAKVISAFETEGLPCRVAASVPPVTVEDLAPVPLSTGVDLADVPAFIIAQLIGAILATILFGWLLGVRKNPKISEGAGD